jgi:hypothetical protein
MKESILKPTFIDDYIAITETLNKYNQGVAKADSSIMKPAFAKEATIFSSNAGALSGGAIAALFQNIDTNFTATPESRAVNAYIDITGTAASARVDTNDSSGGRCFTDYFHLLKIDGQWIILSKIFHSHPTA